MKKQNLEVYANFDCAILKALDEVSNFCKKNNFKELDIRLLQYTLAKNICFASLVQYQDGTKSLIEAKDEIRKILDMVFEYCLKDIESQKNKNKDT